MKQSLLKKANSKAKEKRIQKKNWKFSSQKNKEK